MAKIFCIANQKGGVGKTTTTVNLSAALAAIGQRVLMVDLDPQGNATMGSGVDKRQLTHTVYDVLLGESTIAQARVSSHWGEAAAKPNAAKYHVLGANRELAGAEVELVSLEQREMRLKLALQQVDADYDIVLIDCPPSCHCSPSMDCVPHTASSCPCSASISHSRDSPTWSIPSNKFTPTLTMI